MNRRGFISAGCWTLDRIKLVDRWPQEESLAAISALEQQGGGSGYNFGVDVRKLDNSMPVEAIGLLGDDADGEYLNQLAKSVAINTKQLHQTAAASTAFTDVMSVTNSGKRTFFHHPGANDLLTPDHFEFSHSNARLLHLGLLGVHRRLDAAWQQDANGWVTILKKARSAGISTNIELVSIEPQRIRDLCEPCLPYLNLLVVNDYEIGGLTGVQTIVDGITNTDACRTAAIQVKGHGAMEAVVVHYPDGAICVSDHGVEQVSSWSLLAADIVGSAGAGDAFAAGFLYAWHEQWRYRDAMLLGHATAAASLRSATTVGSVESVERCLQYVGHYRNESGQVVPLETTEE